jgi:dienelactone hydrolase
MRPRPAIVLLAVLAALASPASAALKSKVVNYEQGGVQLQGYLAWDDAVKGKRPGVLIVHEWWGLNDHARKSADKLAAAGYVAFALDMFGKGKLAKHPEEAQAFIAEATKDPVVIVERFNVALALLKKDSRVDAARIGAIGYCFGGSVVLGMARSGADLKAAGTFHAALASPMKAEPGKLKTKLLIQTGDADPMIPADQVAAFEKEMTDAGASFRVVHYANARHGFTNPEAGTHGLDALAYDADAAKQSWEELLKFFKAEL